VRLNIELFKYSIFKDFLQKHQLIKDNLYFSPNIDKYSAIFRQLYNMLKQANFHKAVGHLCRMLSDLIYCRQVVQEPFNYFDSQ